MSNDPWKHRSAGMACSTCMWFVEKVKVPVPGEYVVTKGQGTTPDKGPGDVIIEAAPFGRCRRHAPTMSGYPAVFGNDWCGDHKLDENKS